ncbi:ADP-ribosylation factor GTPase-activating protein 2-like [Clytia hemisphaerica]|uniref:Uncharacterized protein n=1 Tax=Clytia hemisphaerica TaxID=252671 RepID=A0A7M5XDE9_9CNID
MQCGGNAKANAFFRQHNLTTSDAGVKYKSRVASMYRDKLSQLAQKAMKEYGTSTLNIDTHAHGPTTPEQKEIDFFQDIETTYTAVPASDSPSIAAKNAKNSAADPNLDVGHMSTSPPKKEVRQSTIGGRKPAPKKKGGLGAKKGGLGATRTKANFSAIETEAQEMDKMKEQTSIATATPTFDEMSDKKSPSTPEDVPLSSSLMYKSSSMKREEEKLKNSDPKKAAQLERLGMGFGNRTNISHSMADSMQSVEQVRPDNETRKKDYYRSNSPTGDGFFDSFDRYGSDNSRSLTEEPPSYDNRFSSKSGGWGLEDMSNSNKTYKSEREDSYSSRSRSSKPSSTSTYSETPSDADFQKKYSGAKGISSDQLFGTGSSDSTNDRLNQYSGSQAISSADLFGDGRSNGASGRTVDYQNLKDSVSNVTGKLSSMASGVIGSLQTRYSGSGNY